MTTVAILLAAGQSRRFGPQDKLLAPLHGAPVVCAVLNTLSQVVLDRRIAVVSSPTVGALAQQHGFEAVYVPPGLPQSVSLSAGIETLGDDAAERVLILLGDMPFIRPDDLARLLAFPPDRPACAALGDTPMPPALFPRKMFAQLSRLSGDRGAGALLRAIPPERRLALSSERLMDIDTAQDLQAASRHMSSH